MKLNRVIYIDDKWVKKIVRFENPREVWYLYYFDTNSTIWKFKQLGNKIIARTPGAHDPYLDFEDWNYLTEQNRTRRVHLEKKIIKAPYEDY